MIRGSTKVGEIFICNQETNGKLEVMSQFLGKAITGFGGGFNRMYVLEEGEGFEGVVSSLHPPDNDIDRLFEDKRQQESPELRGQPKEVHEERVLEFDGENYQDEEHVESEEANQEEIHYMNQMQEHEMDEEDYEENPNQHGYNEGYPQDPNIQEYQQRNEYEGDTKMHRTRGSARSGATGDRARTPGSKFEMGNTRTIQESMGHLKQIVSSKNHILQLTRDGFVFSYGTGEFTVSGHGGSKISPKPQILKHLSDKRIVQVAWGESHSLILTDKNDVYSWGRGYEGQLGVSNKIEIAAKPSYVKAFFRNPVIFVAWGAYYSLAITHDHKLYGWGEARMGQLGLGVKTRIVQTPTYIPVWESEEAVRNKNSSTVSVKEENLKIDTSEAKIIFWSGGLGHTMAISENGDLFVWGFNNCGQLGLGDHKSRWEPRRVEKDIMGNLLPPIQKAVCGYYNSYAIDMFGSVYSWGKGFIGHKNLTLEDLPRKIELNTENRYFSDVFWNKDIVGFYAPIRVYSISPKCGPSQGGTLLSIIGTGLVNSDKLKVRFTYGELNKEVSCTFEPKTRTLYCKTPKFDEYEGQAHPSLKLPSLWVISITIDGINYSECEEKFNIYQVPLLQNNANTVNPKWGSVKGGTELTLLMDIDSGTAKTLFHLTVGFKPARRRIGVPSSKKDPLQSSMIKNQSVEETVNEDGGEGKQRTLNASLHSSVKGSAANIAQSIHEGPVNPLDISVNDVETFGENWVWAAGIYDKGKIICVVPELDEYDPENLQFNIDVALNGQQFTGHPMKFRYYDIKITAIEPPLGPSEGGTNLRFIGTGLYDSPIKRIKFATSKGTREVQATWDRKRSTIGCVVPPLTWLFGGEEVPKDVTDEILKSGMKVSLTFNNQEWIEMPDYRYHDINVARLAYVTGFGENIESEEEKQKLWHAEEAIHAPHAEATDEEIKKWNEEQSKIADTQTEEVITSAKRFGTKMYVYGSNFIKKDGMLKVRFTLGNKVVEIVPIFKNQAKLALEIPDMGEEIEIGQHQVTVDVTVNGESFTKSGKYFLYSAIDRNMSEEELKKLQEAEEKAKAKGAKKK